MMEQDEVKRLVQLLRKARITSLEKLLSRVEEGGASASDFTALMRAANEVETMLPNGANEQAGELASEIINREDSPFLPEDETSGYDPESPLLN